MRNVRGSVTAYCAGSLPSKASSNGANTSDPMPNPITAMPTTNPRLSGNHFTQVAIGVTYAKPTPNPATTP